MFHKNRRNKKSQDLNMLKEQLLNLIGVINKLEPTPHASVCNQLQNQKNKLSALIKNIENLHQECDETVVKMSPEQRKSIKDGLSSFFNFFGWGNRIKDDGSILYDD